MHEPHRLFDALCRLLLGQPEALRAEGNVLLDGFLEKLLLGILEDHADLEAHGPGRRTLLLRLGIDVDIIDEHAARRRLQESVELLQECRLPRSRVTGNGSQRALLDDGRDIAERLMLKRRAGHVDIRDMF